MVYHPPWHLRLPGPKTILSTTVTSKEPCFFHCVTSIPFGSDCPFLPSVMRGCSICQGMRQSSPANEFGSAILRSPATMVQKCYARKVVGVGGPVYNIHHICEVCSSHDLTILSIGLPLYVLFTTLVTCLIISILEYPPK